MFEAKRGFGFSQLAMVGNLHDGNQQKLTEMARTAMSYGCDTLELMAYPITNLPYRVAAEQLRTSGIPNVILSQVFPSSAVDVMGDPIGDPIEFDRAVNTVEHLFDSATSFRRNKVPINHIAINCYMEGRQYDFGEAEMMARVSAYLAQIAHIIAERGLAVQVSVECKQLDTVLLARLIQQANTQYIKAVFNTALETRPEKLYALRGKVGLFRLQGVRQVVPGSIRDTIRWDPLCKVIQLARSHAAIVPQKFGPEAISLEPSWASQVGTPPVPTDAFYPSTIAFFQKKGIV